LTHSDITGDLFLTVDTDYAYDKINKMRDEVLGQWKTSEEKLYLYVYVSVDGNSGTTRAFLRNDIFRRELPLALEAIIRGDDRFFNKHEELNESNIWVHFGSKDPRYRKIEYWGTPNDYKSEVRV
jgi:hypothetical protein